MQQKIFFSNSKGQRLTGVLHLPFGRGPYPAVIVQHGLFVNHNHRLVKLIASKLCRSGFAVLRFSASGHSPSQGDYRDILASRFVEDLRSGINFLKARTEVNKLRIGLVGHSLGAFAALISASLEKDVKAVVSIASFVDAAKQVAILKRRGLYFEYDDYITVWGKKLTKNHYADRKFLNIKKLVPEIHCPLLVIHGTKDKITQATDARKIFKLASEPKGLKIIKNADHNFKNQRQARQVAVLTAKWFKKYLAFKEDEVVNAFIKYKNQILLLKRSGLVSTHQGLWAPVGGYLDGQAVIKQAREEVSEETGIRRSMLKDCLRGKVLRFAEPEIDRVWLINPVLFELKKKPKVRLDWEHTDYQWVGIDEIGKIRPQEQALKHVLKSLELI